MRNIALIFGFEFKSIIRKKSFIVTTIIFCIIAFAAILIPDFIINNKATDDFLNINISDFENTEIKNTESGKRIINEDIGSAFQNAGFYLSEEATKNLEEYPLLSNFNKSYTNQDIMKEDIESEIIDFGVVFESNTKFELIVKGEKQDIAYQIIEQSLTAYNKQLVLSRFDIASDLSSEIYDIDAIGSIDDIQARNSGNMILGIIYTFIMYMIIIMYGSTVSTSVAREKDNRTMEVLIANTKPDYLIIGKSLAAGLAGIVQMLILLLSFFIAANLTGENMIDILQELHMDLDITTILTIVFFGITGYLLYLFIYAGLGAMVSKIEDVNYAVTPITLLFASGYIIAFTGLDTPNSVLFRVFSMVPFTSVLVMPMRSLLVFVPIWELILSVVILFISIIIFIYLAIRIYRLGSLNYGNRMKFLPTMKLIFRGEDN